MQLTSAKNPLLQKIRKAAKTGRPTDEGWVAAEGPHLLAEALRSNWTLESVFATREAMDRHRHLLARTTGTVIEVSNPAFDSMAETQHAQGILATLRPPVWSWEDVLTERCLAVVLDGVQDPGNAGTVARSAEAFGATGLVLLEGCARVSNGKLLRASAGSIFRLPFLEGISRADLLAQLRSSRVTAFGLCPSGGASILEADFRGRCVLVTGAEGAGLSHEVAAAAKPVSVPTAAVESLNAAVACSIALFEAARQRRNHEHERIPPSLVI